MDGERMWVNGGPMLPAHLAEKLRCDAVIKPVWVEQGRPVSVGRTMYAIPERTRRFVLDRDRVCRFPGCTVNRNLELHHIEPYPKGGTDSWNLAGLCDGDHDRRHRGEFTMTGNADEPDGIVFRRRDGSIIQPCGVPIPPAGPLPSPPPGHRYVRPTGERIDHRSVHFNDPQPTLAPQIDDPPQTE